jgi:hypothetical protein
MMDALRDAAQLVALIAAGITLGWSMALSVAAAPIAFRDLDHGRADRLVRNMLKRSHPVMAAIAALAAATGFAAGSLAGGVTLAIAAVCYLMARWALAPREEKLAPAGHRRVLKTTRIVSAGIAAFMIPVVLAGMVFVGLRL